MKKSYKKNRFPEGKQNCIGYQEKETFKSSEKIEKGRYIYVERAYLKYGDDNILL